MLGECPGSWLCWPDSATSLARPATWLALGTDPCPLAALMRHDAALLATTPNPGQRLAAACLWGGVAAAGPSFRQALRRLVLRQHRRTQALGGTRRRSLLGSGTAGFPTHLWRSPRRRALGGWPPRMVSDQWQRFFWVEPAACGGGCGLARAVHCSSNRRRVSPAAHASPWQPETT